MAGVRFRARDDSGDQWPGFVDALATLLLVAIFLLSLFAVAQFALGQALSGRDARLIALENRLADLAEQLALEQSTTEDLRARLGTLQASLAAAEARAVAAEDDALAQRNRVFELEGSLEDTVVLKDEALVRARDLELQLNELNAQLLSLREALEAAEAKDLDQQAQIENLSSRLNQALAQKVQELAQFRSRFFQALTEALGDRDDLRVEGDRFVFATDVLFASGSAELQDAGKVELAKVAQALLDIASRIPDDIDWVIRVDGHTDERPINTAEFPSNWELSTARAISVVKFFEEQGVEPKRLVAAGFGEHRPLVEGSTLAAYAQNRRIEMKLDAR